MTKAQILYWLINPDYRIFFKNARSIDSRRAERFMKRFWVEALPPKEYFDEEYIMEKLNIAVVSHNAKETIQWLRLIKEMRQPSFFFRELSKLEIRMLCELNMIEEAETKLNEVKLPQPDEYFSLAEMK